MGYKGLRETSFDLSLVCERRGREEGTLLEGVPGEQFCELPIFELFFIIIQFAKPWIGLFIMRCVFAHAGL